MTVKAKGMNISKNRGITRLMNETDLVILLLVRSQKGNFKRRSDKFMNEDDRWNWVVLFTQGLPRVGLTDS